MSYRDDIAALASRHATLQAELGRKQRELDEVAAMLAEVRRVEQAESYFAGGPDRRRGRHLAALGILLVTGMLAGVGIAALAPGGARARIDTAVLVEEAVGAAVERAMTRTRAHRISPAELDRLKAREEALRAIGLIPVVAPDGGLDPYGAAHVEAAVRRAQRKAERQAALRAATERQAATATATTAAATAAGAAASAAGEDER